MISRDVIFLEKEFIQESGKGRKIELELKNYDIQTNKIDIDPFSEPIPIDNVSTPVPRRSSRISSW